MNCRHDDPTAPRPLRQCARCGNLFEIDEALDARVAARFGDGTHYQKVCNECVMLAITDMACESVEHMTEAELEEELKAEGYTPEKLEAFKQRMLDAVEKARLRK